MEKLNSELPIDELMRLSRDLAPKRHMDAFNHWLRGSLILNRQAKSRSVFLDLTGIKTLLASYQDRRTMGDDQGNAIPVGQLGNTEYRLRQLWKHAEYSNKINGYSLDRLPGNPLAEDIAESAAKLKLLQQEARAMEKVVREATAQVETARKARNKPVGAYKRDTNGQIFMVDGMRVNSQGIIEETGQPADEYLDGVRAARQACKATA